jgi:Gig2-like
MFALTKSSLQSTATSCLSKSPILVRQLGTHAQATRKEGDISSVFVSLSGVTPEPLPQRFAEIKRQLIQGNENAVTASWKRLLEQLAVENEVVKQRGPSIIPQIQFKNLQNPSQDFITDIKKRGVAVIRGVVPEDEARGYKNEVEEYVKLNPWTKGIYITSYFPWYLLTI